MRSFLRITGFPRKTASPTISSSGKSPYASGCSGSGRHQPPTTVYQYPARMRLPALALELGRFRIAYGAPTASAGGLPESRRLPRVFGGSKVEFDVFDDRHIQTLAVMPALGSFVRLCSSAFILRRSAIERGLRVMNPHQSDEFSDWSKSFDDMDGEAWEEHFALFEADDDRREEEFDEGDSRYNQDFLQQAYAANLELVVRTVALGDLAENDCRIIVHCRTCNHRAVLNPHYLLEKLPNTVNISEIGTRLRCRMCGARSANTRFHPDGLDR